MGHTSTSNLRIGEGQNFDKSARNMVIVEELVDSPDCESGFCGFKSRLSPKLSIIESINKLYRCNSR